MSLKLGSKTLLESRIYEIGRKWGEGARKVASRKKVLEK